MYPTKRWMFRKRSALESDWEADETKWIVQSDQAGLVDGSSILDFLTSTSSEGSITIKRGLGDSRKGSENLVAGRCNTLGAFKTFSICSSDMIQNWQPKTRVKLFKFGIAGTSSTSFVEHVNFVKLGREEDSQVKILFRGRNKFSSWIPHEYEDRASQSH